jgi:hypothetical protein
MCNSQLVKFTEGEHLFNSFTNQKVKDMKFRNPYVLALADEDPVSHISQCSKVVKYDFSTETSNNEVHVI